jgi:hypothetical protein
MCAMYYISKESENGKVRILPTSVYNRRTEVVQSTLQVLRVFFGTVQFYYFNIFRAMSLLHLDTLQSESTHLI